MVVGEYRTKITSKILDAQLVLRMRLRSTFASMIMAVVTVKGDQLKCTATQGFSKLRPTLTHTTSSSQPDAAHLPMTIAIALLSRRCRSNALDVGDGAGVAMLVVRPSHDR